MQFERSIKILMALPVLNVIIVAIFIAAFKYLNWGQAYDSIAAAISLVCIGMLLMLLIIFEAIVIYSVWYWCLADSDADANMISDSFPALYNDENCEM